MAKFWQQTRREKSAHVSGLGLFFAALLGANLGTLGNLPLSDYVFVVVLLVGAVTTIQISMTSERRTYVAALVLLYVAVLGAVYLIPSLRPAMTEEDLTKLLATLGIWLAATVLVELAPVADPPDRSRAGGEG